MKASECCILGLVTDLCTTKTLILWLTLCYVIWKQMKITEKGSTYDNVIQKWKLACIENCKNRGWLQKKNYLLYMSPIKSCIAIYQLLFHGKQTLHAK